MTVEEKIREAMSAYADAIEPKAESLSRIADRIQTGGRRIPWLRYMPAALAMAATMAVVAIQVAPNRSPVVQLATTTPTPAPALDASYTSPNGDWTFDYPKDWTLRKGDATGWLVFNFAPKSFHKILDNGEIVIRWGIGVGATAVPPYVGGEPKTTQDIFDLVCRGGGPAPDYRIPDCRTAEINGRIWVKWIEDSGYGKLLNVSAIFDGKAYRAEAYLGAGDRQDDLLDVASRVFDTFVIR